MATYGTVGGALLGLATMAYGTKFRAVAIGASLGLYAGLIFGGYILASHYYTRQPGISSPYDDNSDYSGGDSGGVGNGGGGIGGGGQAKRWNPYLMMDELRLMDQINRERKYDFRLKNKTNDLIYVDLINYRF
ncbi:MAG: hypothetical protein HQK49_19510 [Oligoflexia bacterium]|nr:hypothetical protein [Oligoflexia bacterium]